MEEGQNTVCIRCRNTFLVVVEKKKRTVESLGFV